jgi:hypothetical protein
MITRRLSSPRTRSSLRTLESLSTDDSYPVPWGFRAADTPDIHRLTNLGALPLDRVSVTVMAGASAAAGWNPGRSVALAPGESLEVRVPHAAVASTVVVCWQRPGGAQYLWSTPI